MVLMPISISLKKGYAVSPLSIITGRRIALYCLKAHYHNIKKSDEWYKWPAQLLRLSPMWPGGGSLSDSLSLGF